MIDATEAVTKAKEYFTNVYKDTPLLEVMLEEAELIDEGKYWAITFSFDWQPASGTRSLGPGERVYKLMKLDSETGSMISMKKSLPTV